MGQARSFLTLGGSFFGNQRIVSWVGLCGIGPALAGNVGTGGAFALSREGDQGVDVPMLAPDLSRCRPGGRGRSYLFTQKGTLFTILMLLQWLRGSGPALAGNVGTGGAFARLREGDQGVDVPMLAPARSRCRPGLLSGVGVGPTYLHKRGHSLLY